MSKDISYYINKGFAYYQDNPKRRCCLNGRCKYSGKTLNIKSKGCFIGQWLEPAERIKADKLSIGDIYELLENNDKDYIDYKKENKIKIPLWIKKTDADLLSRLQQLHDSPLNWDEKGLTDYGKDELIDICYGYHIPLEKITFINLTENE